MRYPVSIYRAIYSGRFPWKNNFTHVQRAVIHLGLRGRPCCSANHGNIAQCGVFATARQLSGKICLPRLQNTKHISMTSVCGADMVTKVLEPVVKSKNDKKEYRAVRLENGLTALLIADTEPEDCIGDGAEAKSEKMSAAALCIGTGSFSDPDDIPGLAHFLEHMVFMGSEKYPDENDFDVFVKKHGGNTNAFTDCERTVFYFDIKKNSMYDGLDRFAQFFISPLMKKDSVDREVESVDSEFDMALQNDHNRKDQLLTRIARKGHPMGKFTWGSKGSLKTIPEKTGINVYERLQEFHKAVYSSHYMTLAVQSRHSLDTLQEWVSDIFSNVTKNDLEKPTFDKLDLPYNTESFFRLYKAVPVKKIHQVEISWSLPCLQKHYRIKPLHYVGWLVGHEGGGSILSLLKKRVWALSLCGGNSESGFEHNTSCALFSISVTLTEQGMDHIHEVLTVIFQYLDMLRRVGPQKWVYEEIRTIEENEFRWQEQTDPAGNVEKVAENMQLYPPEDYLTGESLMFEYDEELIKECQDVLVPEKASFLLYSKRFEEDGVCTETEPWFNIPYNSADVPLHWLESWKDLKPNSDLHLPARNTYIATDFSLKEAKPEANEVPAKVKETEHSRLWYKQDAKFKIPKAYLCFKLMTPVVSESALSAALFDLYVRVLTHNLAEVTYAADCAQLSFSLTTDVTGLKMKFSGFNHKLPRLFETVIDYIADFSCNEDVFDALMDQQKRVYHNTYIKPNRMAQELRLNLILQPYWSTVDKSQTVPEVTLSKLLSFANEFKSKLFVEGLVQGNISQEEAKEIENYLLTKINAETIPSENLVVPRVLMVPAGASYCRVENFNQSDNNSVITNYYQHGPTDIYSFTLNELLVTRMEEPCYAILRTREQLGYSVFCTCRNTDGILALSVTVCSQANKFTMEEVDKQIESFLVEFDGILGSMTEEEFNTLVSSLITLKQCEDTHLGEEVDRNWGEICHQEYVFDRLKKQVEALRKMSLAELRTWFEDHVPKGGKHRKLSIQVVGNKDAGMRKRKHTSGEENEDDADLASKKKCASDRESEEEDGEDDDEGDFSDEEEEDEDNDDESSDESSGEDDDGPVEWKFVETDIMPGNAITNMKEAREEMTLYPPSKVL